MVGCMGDVQIPMSVPLDSDGFLRRECPTCEREFKWRPTPEGEEGEPAPDAGYFCPYCAVQAPIGSWWTKPQLAATESLVFDEVVKTQLDKLADSARRASSGFLEVSVKTTEAEKPPALTETDDMRRIDFECHPSEPIKVLDDWQQSVHCMICGLSAPSP
jgi:hypothetical protein